MYRSVIANLIGSICSPHLRSVSVILSSMVGEVEHFPWDVMNGLTKVSPYMLQWVKIALQLRVETDPDWGITALLSSSDYEDYFRQVRSALPGLDKKVITNIADIPDEVSYSDPDPSGLFQSEYSYDDYDDYDDWRDFDTPGYSSPESFYDEYGYTDDLPDW